MSAAPVIALAGASGDLGFRIAKALVESGASVRALVRPDVSASERAKFEALGITVIAADPADRGAMANAVRGAACVVSALNGLYDLVERQRVLLYAAVEAGVPRFISSDYSEDFTKTTPRRNRNLDLRRAFMQVADAAPIRVTSILNGAFMDMLGAEMPIIQRSVRRVLYWGSADQPLDFTTKDDVAAYTAQAALDPETPRILRIAGGTVTVRDLARTMSTITGDTYRPQWAGGIGILGAMIAIAKLVAPQRGSVFPAWQGMQYMRDMFSGEGKLTSLDNDRYSGLNWTSAEQHLLSLGADQPGTQ